MVESFRTFSHRPVATGISSSCSRLFLPTLLLFLGVGVGFVRGQSPSAAAYPATPSGTAGMTSSTSTGMTARDIQMMQVRTAAQTAQGDAVAASMSRTADRAIDDQNAARVLQQAREEKAIKREMRERMKWDRANAQVKKVSANDMSSWRSDSGNVRVERSVPDPFIASLIEEERQIAAREAAEKKKRGFSPLRSSAAVVTAPVTATKKALSWRPFRGEPGPAPEPSSSLPSSGGGGGGGLFSKIGRGNDAPVQNPATAQPQFVQTSSSRGSAPAPTTAQATVTKPGTVPRISGAALVDGRSPVNQGSSGSSEGAQAAAPSQPVVMTPAGTPEQTSNERSGFFSKLKSGGNDDAPSRSSSGGGFLGFGKKKESSPSGPSIDASLFPSQAVAQAPTGGSLGGGYSSQDVAEDAAQAPSSTGNIVLPGAEPEKRSRGFSLPKPKISVPSFGGGGSSGGGGGSVPTMTTTNSAGTNFYVVTASAQFMIYGNEQMQSEVRALPAGMVVQMTKPGENWASVRLSNGTEGIVQNKFLRAASMSEASTQFNFSN